MIELTSLKSKNKKRVGRGISGGQGKTAGRGTKGQKSRSGFNIPKRFEGGQTPLSMRLPKLPGFKSLRKKAEVISLDMISANYKNGEEVTLENLSERGLSKIGQSVKILNNGELKVKVTISSEIKIAKSAMSKFVVNSKTENIKPTKDFDKKKKAHKSTK